MMYCINMCVAGRLKTSKLSRFQLSILHDIMNDLTLDIRHSSPGVPWEPKFKTRGEVFNSKTAQCIIVSFWAKVRRGAQMYPPPCKISCLTDYKNDTSKIVNCEYPTTIAVGEAQFALPLIQGYLGNKNTPMTYCFDKTVGIPRSLRSQLFLCKFYGCCSFKDFDKRVKRELIEDAFSILMCNINFCEYEGWGVPNADFLINQFEYIKDYFIDIPLITSKGNRYQASSSLPSGSCFTPLIDTVVYWMLGSYGYLKSFGRMPKCEQIHIWW